jgi:hypothetical protein
MALEGSLLTIVILVILVILIIVLVKVFLGVLFIAPYYYNNNDIVIPTWLEHLSI